MRVFLLQGIHQKYIRKFSIQITLVQIFQRLRPDNSLDLSNSAENDPGFFVQFLENDIFGKNSDRSATIFYRADEGHFEQTCFSKASQILFATATGCCP